MKSVTLFRHAKSGQKESPDIDDFDRPLSHRGLKDAPKMGEAMRSQHITPDLILCSPSERTRQTLALAAREAWDSHPDVRFERRLYEASAQALLKALKELPDSASHVMTVGHNPGLQDLAAKLAPPNSQSRQQLKEKLPTGSVVSFSFDIEKWTDLKAGTGSLQLFFSPNTLHEAGTK
jgi:phosphohistidine phosphatase